MDEITVDLAGTWQFTPLMSAEPTQPGALPEPTTTITVPGGGWVKQGFDADAGFYSTFIDVPDTGQAQSTWLVLGAVNHEARYFVGAGPEAARLVKTEVTSFTPQELDLTGLVRPGGRFWLGVEVTAYRNDRAVAPRNWQEKSAGIPRGIFRAAALIVRPPVFVDDIVIKTTVGPDRITWSATVANTGDAPVAARVQPTLDPASDVTWVYPPIPPVDVTVGARSTATVTGEAPWLAGPESYWWPNTPYRPGYRAQLHDLTITLDADGGVQHRRRQRFGFRQLRQAGPHFELNGQVIRFRGDSLQVANYDTIDHGGRGDAIDTLPGFLPPTPECGGWPEAVDNILRLGFNIQRAHRQPWTEYMLDVCDNLGLMILAEGTDGWEEFDHAFHEMKVLSDMVRRDRNHPSIVRWSLKNEPLCVDPTYHRELYDTVKAYDDTRPICEGITLWAPDFYDPYKVFALLLDEPDFTWLEQFLSYGDDGEPYYTAAHHNNAARPIPGRPYGLGGGLWPQCSTQAGLVKFATCIARVRADGADEVRPYTLVSGWVSQVPGVRSDQVMLEELRHPVYGADNLHDPWSLPAIQLIQTACDPLLAMDYDFWAANEESNQAGLFPVVIPDIPAGQTIRRHVVVHNDDLAGEQLELRWALRRESRGNFVDQSGVVPLTIPVGSQQRLDVEFTAPEVDCPVFLELTVYKDGHRRFVDNTTTFQVTGGRPYGYWGQPGNITVPERWLHRQLVPNEDFGVATGATP